MTEHVTADEQYLLVEEVAERLGLPLAVLLRRVEAGDIPARRIENENGVHYSLRLGDLGIDPMSLDGGDGNGNVDTEPLLGNGTHVHLSGGEPANGHMQATVDLTGRRVSGDGDQLAEAAQDRGPDSAREQPQWLEAAEDGFDPADHREPAQPAPTTAPPWLHTEIEAAGETTGPTGEPAFPEATAASHRAAASSAPTPVAEGSSQPLESDFTDPPPPVIARTPAVGLLDTQSTPHGDLAVMSLDARELVAGLLDRWERTLEQRIYTEQRQRFQGELVARQNMVKQLQMELHTARAEHAAAQAEKDRFLAEKERELADRERDLADAKRLAERTEQLVAPAASTPRRRRFWQRTDV